MIPHNMPLFKFICVQYQFHGQTLPIMKIDRGQILFREYVSTGTEPKDATYIATQEQNIYDMEIARVPFVINGSIKLTISLNR